MQVREKESGRHVVSPVSLNEALMDVGRASRPRNRELINGVTDP